MREGGRSVSAARAAPPFRGSSFVLHSESSPMLIIDAPVTHGSDSTPVSAARLPSSNSSLPACVSRAVDATDGDRAVVDEATLAPRLALAAADERPARPVSVVRRGMPEALATAARAFRCTASLLFFGFERRLRVDRALWLPEPRAVPPPSDEVSRAEVPEPVDPYPAVRWPVGAEGPLAGREKARLAVEREVPVGVTDRAPPPTDREFSPAA